MRRPMIALLATCLFSVAAPAVLAQSPAPFGLGGRVEVPEAGYALTLPDGWAYLRPAAEDAEALAAFIDAELKDPDLAMSLVTLATAMHPDDIMLLGMSRAMATALSGVHPRTASPSRASSRQTCRCRSPVMATPEVNRR